jgi:methyl-accepting chemotaxis protein
MKMPSPSIRTTLMGFAIGAIVVGTVPAVITLAGLSRIDDFLSEEQGSAKLQRTTVSVQKAVFEMESELRREAGGKAGTVADRFQAADQTARAGIQELKRLVSGNPEQQKHVREAEDLLSSLQSPSGKPVTGSTGSTAATESTKREQPLARGPQALGALAAVQERLLSLSASHAANADKGLLSAAHTLKNMTLTVYAGTPLYVLVLLAGALLLARYVANPIAQAVTFTEAITQGDMSRRLTLEGFAEARSLETCLNTMAESLAEYNQRVLEGVGVLTGSVAQIAGTASQVLTSASQTVAAVNETTSIVNEMERGAKVVNETARRVAEHSEESDVIANSGTKATHDTLQKMNLIKEKMGIVNEAVIGLSDKTKFVEAIISAVQDLTDQSNLLAVNASIEAARAGEHGKGFAVVASEIKSLADQSREATQRVARTLQEIRNSVGAVVMATEEGGKAVMSGVEQSEAAGVAIQKLAGSIGEFSQAAGIIFASSGKQFSRVERIAGAMRNVELAMNNSVEGTTHVENEAKRLEHLARTLTGLVRHSGSQGAGF